MGQTIVVHAALACFAAISLIVLLRNTARRMGLVDHPGGRKQHEGAVPVVGGLAIFGAFAFSTLLITQAEPLYPFRSLLGGMGLLVLAGVLDDMHDLSAVAKLALQCAAALLMASWGGVYVADLGDLFGLGGSLALGNFAIPFTLVCVLGIINGINMTDGIDGLAGGLTLVSLLAFAALFAELRLPSHLLIASILIGSVVGFLCFNLRHPLRSQANVFLGDAGSMALGFALCWFAVTLTRVPATTRVAPIAIVWLIAVPLLDMGVVILRRVLAGKSPLAADREHLHHLLLRAGFSYAATTWTLLLAAVICAGVGLAIWKYGVRDAWGFYGFIGLLVGTLVFTRVVKNLQSGNPSRQDTEEAASVPGTGASVDDGGVVLLREVEVREIRKR